MGWGTAVPDGPHWVRTDIRVPFFLATLSNPARRINRPLLDLLTLSARVCASTVHYPLDPSRHSAVHRVRVSVRHAQLLLRGGGGPSLPGLRSSGRPRRDSVHHSPRRRRAEMGPRSHDPENHIKTNCSWKKTAHVTSHSVSHFPHLLRTARPHRHVGRLFPIHPQATAGSSPVQRPLAF